MKRMLSSAATILALSLGLAVGATSAVGQEEDDSTDRPAPVGPRLNHPAQANQFYFVMPDRFENGDESNDYGGLEDGDSDEDILRHGYDPTDKAYYHGGDLAGLIDRLDYLEGLGTNAIWLTPSFQNKPVQGDGTIEGSSAGYHGYWITDFTSIDPHTGTNAELEQLVEEAHSRDMKVFFDIITNHTADVISYEEEEFDYIEKSDEPYRGEAGRPFDDRDFINDDEDFPELDAEESFPYTPTVADDEADIKVPAWLNDPTLYHNRGDTDFVDEDEDQRYGDFVGLDDLFTEHPDVVEGMVEIYKSWATDYGVDGFRIDTVKHVNIEFWEEFGPEIQNAAFESGNQDFFMFGEVYSSDKEFLSRYTTQGKLQSILDFSFQESARGFASGGEPTENMQEFFAEDDYFTDSDSNAYALPTFLGNHDMGRFGFFIEQDNPDASDEEILDRDILGHEFMYFVRGMPVVYYGDEQGFVGVEPGNDQSARQDMFPTETEEFQGQAQIGTDASPSDDNFDTAHPLYEKFAELGEVRREYLALRNGAQVHRYATDEAGIYAFSRIHRDYQREYVIAANNATEQKTATFDTYSPDTRFIPVYGGGEELETNADGEITVEVPALSTVVYRAEETIPESGSAPDITLGELPEEVEERFDISAKLSEEKFSEVTFSVRVGEDENFEVAGTDDNAPYRIFYDTSDLEDGTELEIQAAVSDLNGNTNATETQTATFRQGEPSEG